MQQHSDTNLKEEVTLSKIPLSTLVKTPKKPSYKDALIQITLEPHDEVGIRVADRYHTLWNLYLCDPNWYAEFGSSLMHLFKNFMICKADRGSRFTGRDSNSMEINNLIEKRLLVLPIVHMSIHNGQITSLVLQGMNTKNQHVARQSININSANFAVMDICLNKQWVRIPHESQFLYSLQGRWRNNFSEAQITAMGTAFESDGKQIEDSIEAAFGEAVGVFHENH